MSVYKSDAEQALYAYMHGWRTGARGGMPPTFTPETPERVAYVAGYEDGRKAQSEAYRAACETYGAELSPLR
jgi:hypothetical protein